MNLHKSFSTYCITINIHSNDLMKCHYMLFNKIIVNTEASSKNGINGTANLT